MLETMRGMELPQPAPCLEALPGRVPWCAELGEGRDSAAPGRLDAGSMQDGKDKKGTASDCSVLPYLSMTAAGRHRLSRHHAACAVIDTLGGKPTIPKTPVSSLSAPKRGWLAVSRRLQCNACSRVALTAGRRLGIGWPVVCVSSQLLLRHRWAASSSYRRAGPRLPERGQVGSGPGAVVAGADRSRFRAIGCVCEKARMGQYGIPQLPPVFCLDWENVDEAERQVESVRENEEESAQKPGKSPDARAAPLLPPSGARLGKAGWASW